MNYDFKRGNLTTDSGTQYNIEHCLKGMNKFPESSKEYKLFAKVFVYICRKASRERFSDSRLV